MATPCIGTKCYSIRIYPAYDGNAMYLVFMGESYINGTDDKPETMLNNNFYKIISDDSKDLEIVPPSDRQKTIDEIKDFQTLYGKSSLFNLKSLVFDVSEYLTMKRQFGQNPQHSEGSGKQFWFRLRPAYNKLSLSTNKLYFVVNEEEITFGDNGAIYKRLLDDVQTGNSQYWYNHMEPCPDKCPLIEIEN